MTTATHRVKVSVEQFEAIAHDTAEDVLLELIRGRAGVKAMPDGNHLETVTRLVKLFARLRPELSLHRELQLRVERGRAGRARVDAALVPDDAFTGQPGEWFDPAPVLMVVEMTSFDTDTDRRRRREKPRAYAEAGIPVYLLIDRKTYIRVIQSDPTDDG